MSDQPGGPGWWQASDGKWYPPQSPVPPGSSPTPEGQWHPPPRRKKKRHAYFPPRPDQPEGPLPETPYDQIKAWFQVSTLRQFAAVAVLTAIVGGGLLLVVLLGGQADDDGGSSEASSARSTEYKLAVIDGEFPTSESDPVVRRYAIPLDSLEEKCSESRARLGDIAVVGTEGLTDAGQDMTVLLMLQSMNESIPPDMGRTSCLDIATAVVALMLG